MTSKPMTNEEHDARAMLMGRLYDPSSHSYFLPDVRNIGPDEQMDICADTLEHVLPAEVMRRHQEKNSLRQNQFYFPPQETY